MTKLDRYIHLYTIKNQNLSIGESLTISESLEMLFLKKEIEEMEEFYNKYKPDELTGYFRNLEENQRTQEDIENAEIVERLKEFVNTLELETYEGTPTDDQVKLMLKLEDFLKK